MHYSLFRSVLALGSLASALILGAQTVSPSAESDIRAVIAAQAQAWNDGSIDGFMNGYAKSEKTLFVSGDKVSRGWQTVHDHYASKYNSRAKMGQLTFSELEVNQFCADAAVVIGVWQLEVEGQHPHGRFTLIFRKLSEGWRIVQDHTSSAAE